MAKGKFQVNMVGSPDTPIEKEREIFSGILDKLLKKSKQEKLSSPELPDKQQNLMSEYNFVPVSYFDEQDIKEKIALETEGENEQPEDDEI